MLYKVVLTFESVGEILKCDRLNESCRAVLDGGAIYCAVQGGLSLCYSEQYCRPEERGCSFCVLGL